MSLPLVLLGLMALGVGSAVNLQARFAVTDYSSAENRGRDLSMVVWATTVGAIIGPNLNGIGVILGDAIGMPELTGPFIFTVAAQLAAASLYWWGIGPNVPTVTVTRSAAATAAKLSRAVPFAIAVTGIRNSQRQDWAYPGSDFRTGGLGHQSGNHGLVPDGPHHGDDRTCPSRPRLERQHRGGQRVDWRTLARTEATHDSGSQ